MSGSSRQAWNRRSQLSCRTHERSDCLISASVHWLRALRGLMMNGWQRRVTATEAGLIYCAEPLFVSALALFLPGWFSLWTGVNYPNEHLTARLLAGGTLLTAANVLLQSRWREGKVAIRES